MEFDEWRVTTTFPQSSANGMVVPYGDTFATMGGASVGTEVSETLIKLERAFRRRTDTTVLLKKHI